MKSLNKACQPWNYKPWCSAKSLVYSFLTVCQFSGSCIVICCPQFLFLGTGIDMDGLLLGFGQDL